MTTYCVLIWLQEKSVHRTLYHDVKELTLFIEFINFFRRHCIFTERIGLEIWVNPTDLAKIQISAKTWKKIIIAVLTRGLNNTIEMTLW